MNQRDVSNPDPRIQDALTALEKIKLETIEDEEFEGQDVYLDGRHFRNCTFKQCRIYMKLGVFRVEGKFTDSQVFFDGPAGHVKELVDLLA